MLSPGYLMCLIRIPIHNSLQKTFSTLNTKLVFLAVTLPHTERPPTVPVSVFFFSSPLRAMYIPVHGFL